MCEVFEYDDYLICKHCGRKIQKGETFVMDCFDHVFCDGDCAYDWLELEEAQNGGK